jgi:hypothetical protein
MMHQAPSSCCNCCSCCRCYLLTPSSICHARIS